MENNTITFKAHAQNNEIYSTNALLKNLAGLMRYIVV